MNRPEVESVEWHIIGRDGQAFEWCNSHASAMAHATHPETKRIEKISTYCREIEIVWPEEDDDE